jgi:UDP-2,4-diacetamido-2,4,6-trideoxy-beta-L-altropyranose hydrolase
MTAKPRWAFRVASKPKDGGGHVKRCLSLAREMRSEAEINFVLDDEGGHWNALLNAESVQTLLVEDALQLHWNGCLLDGYDFTTKETEHWRKASEQMVVIDDVGAPNKNADTIIRPTVVGGPPAEPGQTLLDGLEYALIDPAYAAGETRNHKASVRDILVSLGLQDSRNVCSVAINALERAFRDPPDNFAHDEFKIVVAIGPAAPHLAHLKNMAKNSGMQIEIVTDKDDLIELVSGSDLMIGAGGVSLLERLSAGLPSVSIAVAENQIPSVALAAEAGATLESGYDVEDLANNIFRVVTDADFRQELSTRGQQLVDGRGCERIYKALLTSTPKSDLGPLIS